MVARQSKGLSNSQLILYLNYFKTWIMLKRLLGRKGDGKRCLLGGSCDVLHVIHSPIVLCQHRDEQS